jgi:uncharacterized protein (TIGR02147 family)
MNINVSTQSLRDHLSAELARRCAKNPKYSLRSFAKFLGLDASALHRLLNGERKVTPQIFERVSGALQFSPKEKEQFAASEKLTSFELPAFDFAPTDTEVFEVISSWYHLAILELLTTKGFQQNHKWIAKRLGLNVHEARQAVESLFRTGFLEDPDGTWRLSHRHNTFAKDGFTSVARKKLQKAFLARATECIDELSMDLRDNSGVTIAVNTRDLPKVVDAITQFRKKMAALAAGFKNPNEVYQISVALFPLTKVSIKELP